MDARDLTLPRAPEALHVHLGGYLDFNIFKIINICLRKTSTQLAALCVCGGGRVSSPQVHLKVRKSVMF